ERRSARSDFFNFAVLLFTFLKPLSQPAFQEQGYNEQRQQGKRQIGAFAAFLERFERNDLGANRPQLGLQLGGADLVQARFQERRIDRVHLRHFAALVGNRQRHAIDAGALVFLDGRDAAVLGRGHGDLRGLFVGPGDAQAFADEAGRQGNFFHRADGDAAVQGAAVGAGQILREGLHQRQVNRFERQVGPVAIGRRGHEQNRSRADFLFEQERLAAGQRNQRRASRAGAQVAQ